MATSRPRNRRLEQVADYQEVRRSPRLVGRISSYRDDHRSQLISSRPSLKSYGRTKQGSREVSILNESGQSVPATFDEDGGDRRPGVPPHLFGLDDSDADSNASSVGQHRTYQSLETNRVLHVTPVNKHHSDNEVGTVAKCWSFIKSCLYQVGSFVYLAATGLLCLDVIILNRFFNYGKQMSCARYLFLPLVLMAVLFFLIGGRWIGESAVPKVDNVDMPAVLRTVANQVENELNEFKKTFKSETESLVSNIVETNVHDIESKTRLAITEELAEHDTIIAGHRNKLADQLTMQLSEKMAAFEDRLYSIQDALASLSQKIKDLETLKNLGSSDQEEANKAITQLQSSLAITMDSLKQELEDLIHSANNSLSDKIDMVSEKTSQLSDTVEDVQMKLESSSTAMSSIKNRLDDHEIQLANMKNQQEEILVTLSVLRDSTLSKIENLEQLSESKVTSDQAMNIFHEELNNILADPNSALVIWLSENSASPDSVKKLEAQIANLIPDSPAGGLSRKDVENLISASLEKYSADRIGKFDFALENSGGNVITDKCSPTFTQSLSTLTFFGYPLWHSCGTPKTIIKPQVYPGDCWAMNGTSGYATIQLVGKIIITEVTVEHIATQLTPNNTVDSAPKDISVYGMSSVEDEKGTLLGKFTYDIDRSPIQQYPMQLSSVSYDIVRFKFKSNYGNPAFTCIYRVRVHGHYPN